MQSHYEDRPDPEPGITAWGSPSSADAEVRLEGFLVVSVARGVCRTLWQRLSARPAQLWLDLESVKGSDAVGVAILLQAVRLAEKLGVTLKILPSASLYRAFLDAGIVDELPLYRSGPGPIVFEEPETSEAIEPATTAGLATRRLALRPPTWKELLLFEQWSHDPLLDQMVGSQLLYLARHRGPYHPDFTARAFHDATALTLCVSPRDAPTPIGFVRLFNINLVEGFAFLESAVVHPRARRLGFGIEACRLLLAFAMDALGLRRVEVKVYAYNVLSLNAVTRNGFVCEGVLRNVRTYDHRHWDMFVFALLDDEMRAQRAPDLLEYLGFWPPDARA